MQVNRRSVSRTKCCREIPPRNYLPSGGYRVYLYDSNKNQILVYFWQDFSIKKCNHESNLIYDYFLPIRSWGLRFQLYLVEIVISFYILERDWEVNLVNFSKFSMCKIAQDRDNKKNILKFQLLYSGHTYLTFFNLGTVCTHFWYYIETSKATV